MSGALRKRAIVVCLGASREGRRDQPIGIVNPEILEARRELPDFDGCLSLPGICAETVRPHFIRLRGVDEHGKPIERMLVSTGTQIEGPGPILMTLREGRALRPPHRNCRKSPKGPSSGLLSQEGFDGARSAVG